MKSKQARNLGAIETIVYVQGLAQGAGAALAGVSADVADVILIEAFARGVRAQRERSSSFSVVIKEWADNG